MTSTVVMLACHIELSVTINVGECNMGSLYDIICVLHSAISLFTMALHTPSNQHTALICNFSSVDQKALYWSGCCYHSCCI